jgi:hypothetical protein
MHLGLNLGEKQDGGYANTKEILFFAHDAAEGGNYIKAQEFLLKVSD